MSRGRVAGLLFNNFWLKVLSLGMAVALWWGVARDPMAEVPITLPLEFLHVPDNLEISSETIPRVQVRLRGPERVVRQAAQNSEVHVTLDLAKIAPGEHTFDLTARQIHVPNEVQVVQVIPTQMRIELDRRASKQVKIQPRVIGTFASGFHIARVSSDPAMITIVGPEKRVDRIESAVTDPVDATGTIGRSSFTTHAYVSDPLVRVTNPSSIRVTVITEKSNAPAGSL